MEGNKKEPCERILVTGGAGYVGSALIPRLLERGHDVAVLDTFWYGDVFSHLKSNPNLHQIKGDIRNRDLVREVMVNQDAVIHLACISNDPSFDLNPSLGFSINLLSFPHLVSAAKKSGVKRFIYASSSSVYGVKDTPNVKEDAMPQPLTDYSRFKLACEEILHNFADDMPFTIIRPATVCGYAPRLRLDLVVNILTINGLDAKVIKVDGGSQLRPNINIEDMVRVYETVLDAPLESVNGKTFNAGYENHSVGDIANIVKGVVTDAEIKVVPTNDNRSYHINSDKIRQELGFVPKYTIREAVETLVKAHREGRIHDGLNNALYHNKKRMKEIGVQ